ncbi:CotH kinase family protein, partial [bacterium]|nr:CotH kinase family protein [bacterium]
HFYGKEGIFDNATKHGRDWERPVTMEYFNKDGTREFSVGCGARVHGGFSRNSGGKLSLRLYFRSEYGAAKLRVPFFQSSEVEFFDNIVLRANYNDQVGFSFGKDAGWTSLSVKDEFARTLFSEMGHLAPSGRFVALYLNGRLRGLYNPVERIDEKFLKAHFGSKTEWDLVKSAGGSGFEFKSGDDQAWRDLENWLDTVDPRDPEYMNELAARVDIDQYLDYWFLNVWLDNRDWPHNNFYAYRNREGGPWRFLPWDTEMTLGSWHDGFHMDRDTFSRASVPRDLRDIPNIVSKLIYVSLESPAFRKVLRQAHRRIEQGVMKADHVADVLSKMLHEIESLIDEELSLWGAGRTREQFAVAEGLAKEFIRARWPIVTEHASDRVRDLETFHSLRRDRSQEGFDKLWEVIKNPAQSKTLRRDCIVTACNNFPNSPQTFELLSDLVKENADSLITESALEGFGRLEMTPTRQTEVGDLLQRFVGTNPGVPSAIQAAKVMTQLNLPEASTAYRDILASIGNWDDLSSLLTNIGDDPQAEILSALEAVLLRLDTTTSGAYIRYLVAERVLAKIPSSHSLQLAATLLAKEPDSQGFSAWNHSASNALIKAIGVMGMAAGQEALNQVLRNDRFPKKVKDLARETIKKLEESLIRTNVP